MKIKVNTSEVSANSSHRIVKGDLVLIESADHDLSDRYLITTVPTHVKVNMPKVDVPKSVTIPSVTLDFGKMKDSALRAVKNVASMNVDDLKKKASDASHAVHEKIESAKAKTAEATAKHVPTVLAIDIYTGESINLNKHYEKLGGEDLTALYVASLTHPAIFPDLLINGYQSETSDMVLLGLNDLSAEKFVYAGRFEKDYDDSVDDTAMNLADKLFSDPSSYIGSTPATPSKNSDSEVHIGPDSEMPKDTVPFVVPENKKEVNEKDTKKALSDNAKKAILSAYKATTKKVHDVLDTKKAPSENSDARTSEEASAEKQAEEKTTGNAEKSNAIKAVLNALPEKTRQAFYKDLTDAIKDFNRDQDNK